MQKISGKEFNDRFLECAIWYQNTDSQARLYGDQLWFKGHTINLGAKRQLLAIIKILFNAQNTPLTLRQLIVNLGEIKNYDSCSDRLIRTYRQKILKSLQRSRHFLRESYRDSGVNCDWIPYNRKHGTWKLYGKSKRPLFRATKNPRQKKKNSLKKTLRLD